MKAIIVLFCCLFIQIIYCDYGTITTVIGDGKTFTDTGDGGLASLATVFDVYSVIVDKNRNVYMVDLSAHKIRKMEDSTKIITTIAGNGTEGFSGNNGPATLASLSFPFSIGLNSNDDLFIADSNNRQIRKVSNGIITEFIGPNITDSLGIQMGNIISMTIDKNDNIFFIDLTNGFIYKFDFQQNILNRISGSTIGKFYNGENIPAFQSALDSPTFITFHPNGDLYFIEQQRIRKIDRNTNLITTVVGNGIQTFHGDGGLATSASINTPKSMGFDRIGNMIIADSNNFRIRKVDFNTSIITTITSNQVDLNSQNTGDGQPLSIATFFGLNSVFIDTFDNMWIGTGAAVRLSFVSSYIGGSCSTIQDCPFDSNWDQNCYNVQCIQNQCHYSTSQGQSCDDGIFCNGNDICGGGVCLHNGNPCSGILDSCGQQCNENNQTCAKPKNTACNDKDFCNGSEECDGIGKCSITIPRCNDCQSCDPLRESCFINSIATICKGSNNEKGSCNSGQCIITSNSILQNTAILSGIIVGIVGFILAISIIVFITILKRRKMKYLSFEIPEDILLQHIELGEKLGEGNFGTVYKGTWNDSTDVVLKCLHNQNQLEELISEANLLRQLKHPNIVAFYGMHKSMEPECLYMTMEYMNDGNLYNKLQKERLNLTNEQLEQMISETLKGMVYLESMKIIHRDLASRNLLVSSNGNNGFVIKVSDFGMGRISKEEKLIDSKSTLIPIKWCAPEVIESRTYSNKSDVWSFGIVLWEIYSFADIPYPGQSNNETIRFIKNGGIMSKPERSPDNIYLIMKNCWSKLPENRPSFMELNKMFNQSDRNSISIESIEPNEIRLDNSNTLDISYVAVTNIPDVPLYQTNPSGVKYIY